MILTYTRERDSMFTFADVNDVYCPLPVLLMDERIKPENRYSAMDARAVVVIVFPLGYM
jgi:hypothetical protein